MKVEVVHGTELISKNLGKSIFDDIKQSLNEIYTINRNFVVNDSNWYWRNPKNEITPSVVNSANFITSHFQNNLKKRSWEPEKIIDNQKNFVY